MKHIIEANNAIGRTIKLPDGTVRQYQGKGEWKKIF